VAGHAAVIAAPQTSRVLAVLELKSALEEQLTAILGLPKVPGHQELLAQVEDRHVLDKEGVHSLRRLLLRMSNVETMVVFQRSGGMVQPIRDNEVVSIARTVKDLLGAAEASQARAGSSPV
jgi:nitroreductase